MLRRTVPLNCGRCRPCRILKISKWTNRQLFESFTHEKSCFSTFTLSGDIDPNVSKITLRKLIKSLRQNVSPRTFRFYGVGEYGEQKNRPHYHVSLFGLDVQDLPLLEKSWGKGYVHAGEFNSATAAYTCGHLLKDQTTIDGLSPEFHAMSKGLGREAMKLIADTLHSTYGLNELERVGDVPYKVQIGKKAVYLGSYLRQKLREEMGFSEAQKQEISENFLENAKADVQILRENTPYADYFDDKEIVVMHFQQAALNMVTRQKIKRSKKL